jgi:predicted phosphoribosyltransferase
VAAQDAIDKVRSYADEVVCLDSAYDFFAISQCYQRFPQVSDAEVVAILRASRQRAAP